jgi:ABC-2 type transport system ATP-binding protein
VEELSKGMQQKVQFIVTILHDPELLIFDEPFSGFDPINVNLLKHEILEQKEKGTTIIFSTHNMASVEELCDHIVLINKAKCILDGNVKEIKKRYKTGTFSLTLGGNVRLLEATLRHQYKITEHRQEDDQHHLQIRLLDKTLTTNELLGSLMPLGNIVSFQEVLPNMEDIFIKVVGESGKEE